MRSLVVVSLTLLLAGSAHAQDINIIPRPVEVKKPATPGTFVISPATTIVLEGSGMENTVDFLNDYLSRFYGYKLKITKSEGPHKNAIVLNYERMDHPIAGAYTLNITKEEVYIAGDNESGTFYGMQSLLQLLPMPGQKGANGERLSIPQVSITDYPRFAYRGLHLDAGRHFFPVDFVKKYIDYIALHKMNYFHWHLTEDQGWRIEIKRYPLLTSVGSHRYGTIIGRYPGTGNDNTPYDGFYTQEEIKEVVAYARKRYITIIPEIEMPGHSSAAIAAYPYLSCFPEEPTKIPGVASTGSIAAQQAGTVKLVQETWGVFDDVFCAGKDSTFTFLENVLQEVMELFPSTYIHIGGDECPKTNWKRCPLCQDRIKKLGLKDEHELQSYFIQRIEQYLNSKGRKIIGWDEILEGGLAPNAAVMSWRGEEGGIAAAKQNHTVIMTPGNTCYFDHSQTKNEDSLTIGGFLPLQNVYNYEPIPTGLDEQQAKKIWGAQANVWTEYITNPGKVEYMIFPRLSALSEVLWSPKKKEYTDFEKRLRAQFDRYDLWKVHYSNEYLKLQSSILPAPGNNGVVWHVTSNLRCEYCRIILLDKILLKSDTTYKEVFEIPDWLNDPKGEKGLTKDTVVTHTIKAGEEFIKSSRGVQDTSVRVTQTKTLVAQQMAEAHLYSEIIQRFYFNKATGKKITLATAPSKDYPGQGGAFGLINGSLSDNGINSSEWLGWKGSDMVATIDLGTAQPVSTIRCHLLRQKGSWIYLPASVEAFLSADGTNFTSFGKQTSYTPDKFNMYNAVIEHPSANARYVKVVAKNIGIIPEGQDGASNPGWLFADEIQVD
ncbi:MAG TPA: family 20 glycosylhydrolase [Chitinophagaceae bacterium]